MAINTDEKPVISKATQISIAESLGVRTSTHFITYDPSNKDLSIHPVHTGDIGRIVRIFDVLNERDTGATVYVMDSVFHTLDSVTEVGRFSIPTKSDPGQYDGPKNIRTVERWLRERGDEGSATKVREHFPKIFEPEPTPQPAKTKRRWPWQR